MMLQKWNYEKHEYEPYEVPDDWNCILYSDDMDEVINCAQCGQKIFFGEGYTSREIHVGSGFGYSVCAKCHLEEIAREFVEKVRRTVEKSEAE